MLVSTAAKVLEDIINKSDINKPATSTNDKAFPQNLKQRSLHGSPLSSNQGSPSKIPKSQSIHRFPRRNIEFSRFMSMDQRSISDTEDNDQIQDADEHKTKSCVNLRLTCTNPAQPPHSPGIVVVKAKFIELPKRVAHSFHGKTVASSQLKDQRADSANFINDKKPITSMSSSTECVLMQPSATKPRFITTKVDESQLRGSALKEV